MSEYFCEDCRKPCELQVVDEGIGAYEYWGAPGWDSDPVVYSACCQADVIDGDNLPVSQNELMRQVEQDTSDDFDVPYDYED